MPRKLKPYVPRTQDVLWAENTTRIIRSGGVWGSSFGAYTFDREAKTLTLHAPKSPWDNPITLMMHFRTHYVFGAIGWKTLPEVKWDEIELPDRAVEDWELEVISPEVWETLKKHFCGDLDVEP